MNSMAIRATLLAGLALASLRSEAATVACNGCAQNEYRQLALQLGAGPHIVYDLVHRRSRGFDVYWDSDARSWMSHPLALDPQVGEIVDALADVYAETGGTMMKFVEIHAHEIGINGLGTASAYDVIDDVNLRAHIGDHLASVGLPAGTVSSAIMRMFEMATSAAFGAFGFTDGSSLYVTVRFHDGTTLTFQVVVGNPQGVYIDGSGRSANGDVLLEAASDGFIGSYHFDESTSIHTFLDRARMLGIPITGPQDDDVVRCTFNGSELHCTH